MYFISTSSSLKKKVGDSSDMLGFVEQNRPGNECATGCNLGDVFIVPRSSAVSCFLKHALTCIT